MEENIDAEAVVAHYALQKLHILPSQLLNMDIQEKAFVFASIKVRIEAEKEEQKKIKRAKK